MFTISELSRGVKEYEKLVSTYDISQLKEYERERYIAEKSLINASRTKDKRVYIEIIKKYDDLKNLIGNYKIPSHEECEIYSVILNYTSLINRECNILCNDYDFYTKGKLVSRGTAGGVTVRLYDDVNSEKQMTLNVICKTPNTFDITEDKTLIHEWFVGYTSLNSLRKYIPSFPYIYSIVNCSGVLLDAEIQNVISTCGFFFGAGHTMIFQEDVANSTSVYKYLTKNRDRLSFDMYLNILMQVMFALDMAYKSFNFTHYDLHTDNILVQELPQYFDFDFFAGRITTQIRVVIIDQGFSYISYDANKSRGELFSKPKTSSTKHYGTLNNLKGGVLHDRSYPLFDIFRVFFDIYDLAPIAVKKKFLPLVRFFFRDISLAKALSKTFTSTSFNNFSLPPFLPKLLKYTYQDFIDFIALTYGEELDSFVNFTTHKQKLVIEPTTRLANILNYVEEKNFSDFSVLYPLSKLGVLDSIKFSHSEIKALNNSWKESKHFAVAGLANNYNTIMTLSENLKTIDIPWRVLKYKDIIQPIFFTKFVDNATTLCFIAKNAYSITFFLKIIEVVEDFLDVKEKLNVPKHYKLPPVLMEMSEMMISLASEIMTIFKNIFKNKTKKKDKSVEFFWYSVCSLITLQYAEFCIDLQKNKYFSYGVEV